MGFVYFCGFLTLIAITGTGYFYYQDKKNEKHQTDKRGNL